MTGLRSRAAAASAAALIGFAMVSGCGDDGTVTQQPAATAADNGSQATPATAAAPTEAASGDAESTTDAAAPATTAAAAAVETRAEILQLQGALLDGQQFDFTATAGNDVLLWFWAPW